MYNLNIVLSIISVNFYKEEKYIMSQDANKLIFPVFTPETLYDLKDSVSNESKKYFIVEDFIQPYSKNVQFISINGKNISNLYDTKNTINILYGITVPNLELKNNHWYRFTFLDEEVSNELSIIGETIEHAI